MSLAEGDEAEIEGLLSVDERVAAGCSSAAPGAPSSSSRRPVVEPPRRPSSQATLSPAMPTPPQLTSSARASYRAYLPHRPTLGFRRGFRSSLSAKRDEKEPLTGAGGPSDGGKRKRRAFGSRLHAAWKTPTKWAPIPIGLGAFYLGVKTVQKRFEGDRADIGMAEDGDEMIVRVRGPWQVHVMGALPLRSLSRLWGYLNSFELPIWAREPGFKLYSYAFGCNLDELEEPDLKKYASLGDFFYRTLRPGARPIADAPLVSPADGKVLHFGRISGAKVEQVKGMSYSLDALLGKTDSPGTPAAEDVEFETNKRFDDHDFANINDIDYTLDELLGASQRKVGSDGDAADGDVASLRSNSSSSSSTGDASVPQASMTDNLVHDASVALSLGAEATTGPRSSVSKLREGNALFFAVIYLAPGDYHRFHSPAAWVVEKRRHFAGELFSVSPYIARRLSGLFVLNERVALLGRWKHGFFSMVPVGATNVGSIIINFDKALRTNNRIRSHPAGTYIEAGYSKASALLKGQPLNAGDEMGGFKLGSTIVMVFEAPRNFQFDIKEGELVKVGQPMGHIGPSTKN